MTETEPNEYASVHVFGNKQSGPIDVDAAESAELRARVKAKFVPSGNAAYAATIVQLPDGSWVKGTSVRRVAKEEGGQYTLTLGVKPGKKTGTPKPIVLKYVEERKVTTEVVKQIIIQFSGTKASDYH